MKKRTYKTLAGLLRAYDKKRFTMDDFLSKRKIYDRKSGEWIDFELTDDALRELSDGFAVHCAARKESTTRYSTT